MSKGKILVVDDAEVVRLGINEELTSAGYEVSMAEGGKKAFQLVQKEKFQLAFVDLWMPEMNGVEVCRQIKKCSPQTEVVLISGRPDGFGGLEGEFVKAGGLNFFLYKPFLEGELLEMTEKILKAKSS